MIRLIGICVLALGCVFNSLADDSRPLALQISEHQPQTYWLQWTFPPTLSADNHPQLIIPPYCQGLTRSQIESRALVYHCGQSLAGTTLRLQYPKFTPTSSIIITYKAANGNQHTAVIPPGLNAWQVPVLETHSRVARDYTQLGIQHIWTGTDHLLFLLCLSYTYIKYTISFVFRSLKTPKLFGVDIEESIKQLSENTNYRESLIVTAYIN